MNELWLPVVGYEGLYEISNLGRVKSLPRNGTANFERILKASKNSDVGYLKLSFSKNNIIKTKYIHVVVAEAFLNHVAKKGIVVDHIDNNRTNNKLDNLRVITHTENILRGKNSNTNNSNIYNVNGKFRVLFNRNKNKYDLGYCKTLYEAIKLRDINLKNIENVG
jgi:hypothetical protein